MTQPESKGIVNKLLSLPPDQNEIKIQNLAAVMGNKSDAPWDILELYRAFYPPGVEQKGSHKANPSVADTANSLSDQIVRYQTVLNNLSLAIDANGEASRDLSQTYNEASKDERLKHKLFLARMCQQANDLNQSLKSALNEMEQIDKRNRKYQKAATVCDLPQEIWFHILNQLSKQDLQLCEPFIKATCYPLHVIMRELKASQGWSSLYTGAQTILYQAAEEGQLSYVKFLHDKGVKLSPGMMKKAAASGNFELVKYIHEHGVIIDWPSACSAAESGNSQMVSYALKRVTGEAATRDKETFAIGCLKGGNIEVIKGALDTSFLTFDVAAENQNREIICTHHNGKEIVQLLIESGAPVEKWKSQAEWTWYAAHGPNAECLKYLAEQGFHIAENCAAVPYVLESLQYLHSKFGITNPDLIENAARVGNLDALKFGYEVCKYPLTSEALVRTITPSSYSCFEYLMTNNCQVDAKGVWRQVARYGDERHAKLLLAKNVVFDPVYFEEALSHSYRDKNRDLVMWLAQQGGQLPDNICDLAAKAGHFELLTFAHSQRKPWSDETVVNAVSGCSVQCLEYVLDHGAVMRPEAMYTSDVKCLAVLLERGCPIPYDIEMYFGYSEANAAGNYYLEFMKRQEIARETKIRTSLLNKDL